MTTFVIFLFPYTLSQFYRTFLAVIAPELATELSLRADDLANMSASWFIAFALMQFPIGFALDRFGPRRIVPVLMMAAVAGAVMLSRANTATDCIIANALIGIGCSPIYMGALYCFARSAPAAQFGFLTGAMLGVGSSGNLLAATPLSLAAEAFGWRSSFQAIAALTFLAAVVVLLFIRDPARAEQPARSGSALAEYAELLSMKQLWLVLPLIMMGYGTVLAARGLWIGPYFAEVHGLDAIARGNATLAMAIAMSAGALIFGALDQYTSHRKLLVMGGAAIAAAGFALLWLWPTPELWFAISVLTVVGIAGLFHPVLFAHARSYFPDHLVGRGITLANFVSIGGAGLIQWMSGFLVTGLQATGMAQHSVYAWLYLSFAAMVVAATFAYAFTRPTRND